MQRPGMAIPAAAVLADAATGDHTMADEDAAVVAGAEAKWGEEDNIL